MNYQPFPIYPLKSGLTLNVSPWLAPVDAFTTLRNAYLYQGVLRKRLGYTDFCNTGATRAITGIFELVSQVDASAKLLVADEDFLFLYGTGTLTKINHATLVAAAVWTGTKVNVLQTTNYLGTVYMANGKDRVQKYNGSTFDHLMMDLDGDLDNDVAYATFLATYREWVIAFLTSEDNPTDTGFVVCPQRIRWCTAGDPDDWSNDEFIDIPTSEWIRGVGYLGDDIIVFTDNTTWALRFTGDSTLPFRLDRISDEEGCIAPSSTVGWKRSVFALGRAGLVATDGMDVQRIDTKIPDLSLGWNVSQVYRTFGARLDDTRQILWLFPALGEDDLSGALVFNTDDAAWAVFDMPMNVIGRSTAVATETWQSQIGLGSWAEDEGAWVEGTSQIGYKVALAGDTAGNVYRLNYGGNDSGADIPVDIVSALWNPFKDQGQKARLGFIDFLVETNSGITLTISFYRDFEASAYHSVDLSFDGSGSMTWRRVWAGIAGCVANAHKIRISHTASGQTFKIHAVVPYMKPVKGRTI